MKLPPPKPLDSVFAINNPADLEYELRRHCSTKELDFNQPLSGAEAVFDELVRLGGRIAGDGFISVFHQSFTPESFARVCDALTEVGGLKLRDLLREAWSIYTKDKYPITLDELQRISVRRFNSKEKMDRFDQIGEEVEAELQKQYETGKVLSVEYAKRHRAEFTAIVK